MAAKKPANKQTTGKRGGKRSTSWKPGQSGNPAGRPKDGESWATIIKTVGEMYPGDILEFIGKTSSLGQVIAQLPANVQMKYLITIRIYAALMFEPTAGLWTGLMDRAEGKVKEQVDLTSNGQSFQFSDDERASRVVEILERLRARRAGLPANDGDQTLPPGTEETVDPT